MILVSACNKSKDDELKAKAALADMQAIATQIRVYERITDGRLPGSLSDLVNQPSAAVGVTGWKQLLQKVPVDPWGNQYYYLYLIGTGDFRLRSVGPDGVENTADDVVLK